MKRLFKTGLLIAAITPLAPMAPIAHAETLTMTQQQIERLGIRTAPVVAAKEQTVTSVLGMVTPALNARVQVTAPFAGTVTAFDRMEGEEVNAGDTLAVIASRDLREARAQLQGLTAQHATAKAAADRARELLKEGIISTARQQEAAAKEAEAAANLAAIREIVSRAKATNGDAGEYRLVAPAGGRISGIALKPGERVEEMQTVLTLDSGNVLWIEAGLPAAMVGKVRAGNNVVIEDSGVRGTVVAVAGAIDPNTRSAMLRAAIPADTNLVAGQTVRISVTQEAATGAFSVPRDAVVQMEGGAVVFVAEGSGFTPVPVTVLARGAEDATVTGKLDTSASVAVAGLTELKALTLQE